MERVWSANYKVDPRAPVWYLKGGSMLRSIALLAVGFVLGVIIAKIEDWYSHRKIARKARELLRR